MPERPCLPACLAMVSRLFPHVPSPSVVASVHTLVGRLSVCFCWCALLVCPPYVLPTTASADANTTASTPAAARLCVLVSPSDKLRPFCQKAAGLLCFRAKDRSPNSRPALFGCVRAIVCTSVHHAATAAVAGLAPGPLVVGLCGVCMWFVNTIHGEVFLLLFPVPYRRCLVHVRGGREPFRGCTAAGGLGVVFPFPAS
jgi:hypothetical protein